MDLIEGEDGVVTPVDTKKGKGPHFAEGAYELEQVQMICAQALGEITDYPHYLVRSFPLGPALPNSRRDGTAAAGGDPRSRRPRADPRSRTR